MGGGADNEVAVDWGGGGGGDRFGFGFMVAGWEFPWPKKSGWAMGGAAGGDINADRGGGGGGSTRVRISESMFERAPLSRELRNGRGGCDGGLAVAVVGRRRRANLSHLRHRLYSSIVSYSAGARAAGRRSCAAVPCTVCGW